MVLGVNAGVVLALGLALLVPLALSLLYRDGSWASFLLPAALMVPLGAAGLRASRLREGGLVLERDVYFAVTLAWALAALLGGVPYLLDGTFVSPLDSTFEGMSGFTTTGATLLADIVAGAYDVPIRETCAALGRQAPQTVLVRWGHEMDLLGRFPWSTGNPEEFVGAYRHFVGTCRGTGAANLRYVWSPGGAPDLQDYWPGAQYVDYVGLTVLGFGARDVAQGAARPHTFGELFGTNYALVQGYGKPVLVCEFASTGPAAHQERWVAEAAEGLAAYPLLRGVVYFNAVDPVAWGESGVPDWRIAPEAFPPPRPAPLALVLPAP